MPSNSAVVAIIAAYNEEDIIGQAVGHLVAQGIRIYILDNGSTDGTVNKAVRAAGPELVGVEHLPPDAGANHVSWTAILGRKETLARELDAAWFIHHDADEFRESPWAQVTLREAIDLVDRAGYNAIDFELFNFWPTDDAYVKGVEVQEAFRRYAPPALHDRLQIKCWKKQDQPVDLRSSGGHEVKFEGRRVFPLRFLLRHYPIRSQAHGERKVFKERWQRFAQTERERGWHQQYDAIAPGGSFLRAPEELTPYDPVTARVHLSLRHRGVEDLEGQLERLKAELEELQALHAATQHELSVARDQLATATRELATNRNDLIAATSELAQARASLVASNAELVKVEAALDAWRLETVRTHEQLGAASRRIEDLENSRSWRWTAPLRRAFAFYRGER
jgi:hypothetical protein